MEDPFKPLSLSIKELFGNTNSLYKIPLYQRPYKWGDDQVDKLWDDIFEAYENNEDNYFLGSIITAKPRDDEKTNYADVVDGQQRLTTLMIMFCVLRDLYPNINNKENDDSSAVNIYTIKSSITVNDTAKRLKLNTHSQHQTDFEAIILKEGNTKHLEKPSKDQLKIDEEPKNKFINSAVLLRDKFKELGEDIAYNFVNYVFNQVKIIRIDCKNREFAIKLFQVLNDRGLDLTAADLIKSYLLEKLYKKYAGNDSAKIKEDQFVADWRSMEQTIKNCDISLNDLFIIYEYYILGQNPKKSLYDELQQAFKDSDPNELVGDLKQFASTYHDQIWQAKDKTIYSLRYIRWNMYWKSILLAALHFQYKDYEKLKHHLRRFYYLYWIAGKTLSQIKQTSFNLIKWVKENKPISEIIDELNIKIDNDTIIALATGKLGSKSIADEAWCKPILVMIEYNASDNSIMPYIKLDSDLHLEHILPLKFDKLSEWSHISDIDATKWLNSAGNITLLGGAKNIEASNNPFKIKMEIYKGKGKYDTKNDKVSAFKITQKIVTDFESNKFNQNWTLNAMIDRWEWFYTEAAEILEIDLAEVIKQKLIIA